MKPGEVESNRFPMPLFSPSVRVLRRPPLLRIFLLLLTPCYLGAAEFVIAVSSDADPVKFGLRKLQAAVEARGDVATVKPAASSPAIRVETGAAALGPDGFSLEREGNSLVVAGADARGAMYGILDVAEQLRLGASLSTIQPRTVRPALAFRAIKFNLPFAAYRNGPYLEQHQATVKDLKFWEAFLDMMAENRFNTLTLWSLHPFQFMVVPKHFPEAKSMSEAELAEFRNLWTQVFRLAKERGIETFVINWNTFVSPAFAEAHHVALYSKTGTHIGAGTKEKIVEDYTRECVTQVIDEYPDLTGLGITLGERMGEQTPEERREWLEHTFYAGIAAAKRPVKFIYRAPLSANSGSGGSTSAENDRATRAQLEQPRKNIIGPTYLDFKYNASHAHSSPELFLVHGGKLSDAYWNPVPATYRVVWTMRNEDFIVLRWGQPDFIRQFVANNRSEYIAGAMIGSETYIPALDYISRSGPETARHYAFERQWLFYALWGHLLHEPNLSEDRFVAMFDARYGKGVGRDIFAAWKLASDMPLRFASFYQGTWDGSLYTEGFSTWADFGARRLIDINSLINRAVLDSKRYVGIADYVKAGGKTAPGIFSPLQLADSLDAECADAGKRVASIRRLGTSDDRLEEELADIEAWCAFGNYFAEKLRAGVSLAFARANHDPAEQQRAVQHLRTAISHWESLAQLGARYHRLPVLSPAKEPFSWESLLPEVKRDVELAEAPLPATPSR